MWKTVTPFDTTEHVATPTGHVELWRTDGDLQQWVDEKLPDGGVVGPPGDNRFQVVKRGKAQQIVPPTPVQWDEIHAELKRLFAKPKPAQYVPPPPARPPRDDVPVTLGRCREPGEDDDDKDEDPVPW